MPISILKSQCRYCDITNLNFGDCILVFPVDSNPVFYFCRFDFRDYFITHKFFLGVQKIHDLYAVGGSVFEVFFQIPKGIVIKIVYPMRNLPTKNLRPQFGHL